MIISSNGIDAVAAREHEGTGVAAEEIGELIPAGSSGASLGWFVPAPRTL
jgi:hypothetical protein